MPDQSAGAGPDEFRKPYVDMPMRLTVRQNLTIFGRLYGVTNLSARIEQLASISILAISSVRQRQTLRGTAEDPRRATKALINQPELLLLDEPTASLDPDTADWVRRRHGGLSKGAQRHHLLASHNMLEVERLCDRVIIMKRGRIEDNDSPDRIMARYNRDTLEEVFLDVAQASAGRCLMNGSRHRAFGISCIASTRWCCVIGTS